MRFRLIFFGNKNNKYSNYLRSRESVRCELHNEEQDPYSAFHGRDLNTVVWQKEDQIDGDVVPLTFAGSFIRKFRSYHASDSRFSASQTSLVTRL